MLTEKQLTIFGLLGRNVFREYTFKDLKELSGEKSHSLLQNALSRFVSEELVTERKIGTSRLYKINDCNDMAFMYLELYNNLQLPKVVRVCIKHIKAELNKKGVFYSLVIFGSRVDSTHTDKSDLDVAVFIQEKKMQKQMEAAMQSAGYECVLDLDAHVISSEEMHELLTVEYANLGKEIVCKNLPVFGTAIFYRLIFRSIHRDFDPLSRTGKK